MKIPLKYRLWIITFPIVVLLDQWTKHLILVHFKLGESLPVIPGFFNLTYVQNMGAAFSFLNDAPAAFRVPFFYVVPLGILTVITMTFRQMEPDKRWTAFALSLVSGGAIGNLIDRIQLGSVVDFLHFHYRYKYYWPMFNIADSAIVVGVGILLLESFRKEARK